MRKKITRVERRRFLKTAASAAATAFAAPYIIPSSALGLDGFTAPSERFVLGGIGIGNRGSYDLGCFLEQPDVQFVAVCDIKAARREAVKKIADQKYGNQNCTMYRDFRELLDRPDIDAVLIATGPNWHATAAMNAAQAGKDMYCEKPCTKNISQSLILAQTMRRTGRVFQAGTQRRNLPHFAFACELARTGKLGKMKTIYAHPAGMTTFSSGWLAPEPEPPKEVDRLEYVSRSGRLATVQPSESRRFQFRKRGRAGWRRSAGMGFALRRSLPIGHGHRRHGAGRIQSAERWPAAGPLRQRRGARSSAKTAGFRWAPARCVSKAKPAGSKRAIAENSC